MHPIKPDPRQTLKVTHDRKSPSRSSGSEITVYAWFFVFLFFNVLALSCDLVLVHLVDDAILTLVWVLKELPKLTPYRYYINSTHFPVTFLSEVKTWILALCGFCPTSRCLQLTPAVCWTFSFCRLNVEI